MLLLMFFLLALGVGALAFFAGLAVWQAALVGLGAFVGINLLYALFWLIVSLTVDDTKPIGAVRPICSFGCASIAGWICTWTGVRIRLSGEQLLPEQGRFLLVCNHRSGFDPIITVHALRRYCLAFISKPSNLKIPFYGKLAYGAGFLPIDRENDREALKTILRAADMLRKDLCSFCIYPEGTRSKTGELGPFHAGSFKIAQRAGVPVAVAVVRGTAEITPHILRRGKRASLEILELIPAEQVKAMSTQELAAHFCALMQEALAAEASE